MKTIHSVRVSGNPKNPKVTIKVELSQSVPLYGFMGEAKILNTIRHDRLHPVMNPELVEAFFKEVSRVVEEAYPGGAVVYGREV